MSGTKHLLLFPYPTWGHIKPICGFAARLIRTRRPIYITLLTSWIYLEAANREFARYFVAEEDFEIRDQITAISIDEKGTWDYTSTLDAFNAAYDCLVASDPLTCTQTGLSYQVDARPDIVICDPLQYEALQYVQNHDAGPIDVFAWVPGNAAAYYYSHTRLGDFDAKITEEVARTGKSADEVADALYRHVDGRIVNRRGMAPFYDYEWWPQEPTFPEPALMLRYSFKFLEECDGALLATPDAFQHHAIAVWAESFAETSRPVYALSPLLAPHTVWAAAAEAPDDPVAVFLNAALNRAGKHSLVFISFGNLLWPGNSEYVWALLDTLIELNFPFIMAHPNPLLRIPDDVSARVEASGLGLLQPWAPQEMILAHAATGWFVSHCGQNSTIESLSYGVPIICWPIFADQSANAAQVRAFGVGYELVQVRTGNLGLRPLLRGVTPVGTLSAVRQEFRTVFTSARGVVGAHLRGAAGLLAADLAEAWEDGGICVAEMAKFVEMLFAW